jgi:hypothetical protein
MKVPVNWKSAFQLWGQTKDLGGKRTFLEKDVSVRRYRFFVIEVEIPCVDHVPKTMRIVHTAQSKHHPGADLTLEMICLEARGLALTCRTRYFRDITRFTRLLSNCNMKRLGFADEVGLQSSHFRPLFSTSL